MSNIKYQISNIKMRITGSRIRLLLLGITLIGFMVISLRLVDPSVEAVFPQKIPDSNIISISVNNLNLNNSSRNTHGSCATVEEMREVFGGDFTAWKDSLHVRRLVHHHLLVNGATRIRQLPPDQFCSHGFVIAKASEAAFGNEMYKILSGAALSIMLNRSFIRHIGSL